MFPWFTSSYLVFILLITPFNVQYTHATWPSINNSSIQLIGLFPDQQNSSTPTTASYHSRAMFKAAILLAQQYNINIQGQFIDGQAIQTGGDLITAISQTCQAVSQSNVLGIVGPAYTREATYIAPFADRIGIPVISYAATDPTLSDQTQFPAFHRTVASDYTATIAIVQLFTQYNWTSSIIIYQNDDFGTDGAKMIAQKLNGVDVLVTQTILYDLSTQQIRGDLKTILTSSSSRIVILWMDTINTPLVIQTALDNHVLGPDFTWILSSSIALDTFNQSYTQNLIGMLTIEPVVGNVVNAPINTTLLNAAYSLWKQYEPETFPGSNDVNYYALFAFDATWSLILSLQELCSSSSFSSSSSCVEMMNASTCFDVRFLNSNALFNTIDNISFLGVSGSLQFSNQTTDRIGGIYYVAQNSQPSAGSVTFTPVLKYSQSAGWNLLTTTTIILWPGSSLTPPNDLPLLEGITLKIAVTQAVPFTMLTYEVDDFGRNTTKFIGYVPDLIAKLQYNMKFIPQLILPSGRTYNQIVQDVENGVYDLFMSDVTITSTRRQVAGFSEPIFDNALRIMMRSSNDDSVDLLGFLRTFSYSLWLLLLATGVYAAGLVCLIERQDNEVLQNRSPISLISMGLWYVLGVIVGYGVDFHVRTAAGRLLTAGLYIISLVFVATYTANLASYLTVVRPKMLISGIDDIKKGKIPFNRIGIRPGTSFESYYLREISNGVKNYYPLTSSSQLYTALLNDYVDVTFIDSGVGEYATNNLYCNLTLIGAEFELSKFGIAVAKNWIYAKDLDINILSLRESGDLDDLRAKWFQSKTCPTASNQPNPMGVYSLGGLFITFGIISILSVFVYIWHIRHIIANYISGIYRRRKTSVQIEIPVMENSVKLDKGFLDFDPKSPATEHL